MSKLRQEERDSAVPQDKGFANEGDLHPSDRAVLGLESEDENRDAEDRETGSLADDDDLYKDVGTQPRSEANSVQSSNDDQETMDGLGELDEAVREQSEDRATGDTKGFDI